MYQCKLLFRWSAEHDAGWISNLGPEASKETGPHPRHYNMAGQWRECRSQSLV